MAMLALRSALRTPAVLGVQARGFQTTSAANISFWKFFTSNEKSYFSPPTYHATGVEKYELIAKELGNDDPFLMEPLDMSLEKEGWGTKEKPFIVNSFEEFRVIGCICSPHQTHVKWYMLFEGKMKRCSCGRCYVLNRVPAPDMTQMQI